MTEDVQISDADGVRTIRLNRPAKKNAITRAMYLAMAEALNGANAEADMRVVILAGQDGCFTAGNDLVDFTEDPPHIGGAETPPVEHFMRALMGCEKPVIAAVDGIAVGIGLTLLLHCDLAYATERSTFSAPFVDLALAPEFGSSQLLPGLLGRVVASELLLLGARWPASRAAEKNLVSDLLPEAGFEDAVRERALTLAAKAPAAVKAAKALITRPAEDIIGRIEHEGALFADQLRSEEFNEAASAFMERRKPDFSRFG